METYVSEVTDLQYDIRFDLRLFGGRAPKMALQSIHTYTFVRLKEFNHFLNARLGKGAEPEKGVKTCTQQLRVLSQCSSFSKETWIVDCPEWGRLIAGEREGNKTRFDPSSNNEQKD